MDNTFLKNKKKPPPPQHQTYIPQYVVKGLEPEETKLGQHAVFGERVDANEVRNAVNMQTFGAMSKTSKPFARSVGHAPVVTNEEREADERYLVRGEVPFEAAPPPQQYINRQPIPQLPKPLPPRPQALRQQVRTAGWTSTQDVIEADEIPLPPVYQQQSPWNKVDVMPSYQVTTQPDANDFIEVEVVESFSDVQEEEYCLMVGDQLISATKLDSIMEVVEHILDSDEPQYQQFDLSDIALFKRIPLRFGYHVKD